MSKQAKKIVALVVLFTITSPIVFALPPDTAQAYYQKAQNDHFWGGASFIGGYLVFGVGLLAAVQPLTSSSYYTSPSASTTAISLLIGGSIAAVLGIGMVAYGDFSMKEASERIESGAVMVQYNVTGKLLELAIKNDAPALKIVACATGVVPEQLFVPVMEGYPVLGMTEELLVIAMGEVIRANYTVMAGLIQKQFVFDEWYVYTENGIVTSFQHTYLRNR